MEEQFRPYDRVFKRFYTKVEYVPHLEDVTARVDKFTIYFPEGDAQKGLRRALWPGLGRALLGGGGRCRLGGHHEPRHPQGRGLASAGGASGRPAEGMMAFGDTFNDAEMLKAAKYGFLVENGSPPSGRRCHSLRRPTPAPA